MEHLEHLELEKAQAHRVYEEETQRQREENIDMDLALQIEEEIIRERDSTEN